MTAPVQGPNAIFFVSRSTELAPQQQIRAMRLAKVDSPFVRHFTLSADDGLHQAPSSRNLERVGIRIRVVVIRRIAYRR